MNIGVISLGCAKNQVDTQTMLGYLKAAGHTFTGEPERVVIGNDIDAFTGELWENLDPDNRISLYVRFVELQSGTYTERIINRNR